MSNKDECIEAFKEWYYQDGADWNAPHVRHVWEAAWHAAVKAERETCKSIEVVLDEKTCALYVENAKLKDELHNAVARAVLGEREACARIYDGFVARRLPTEFGRMIAEEIRARSTT